MTLITTKIFRALAVLSLSLAFTAFYAPCASATHLVGGELSLQHLGNDQFEVTLFVYFDNINGNPGADDPSVPVSIFRALDETNMADFILPRVTAVNLAIDNPACTAPTLSTRRIIYRSTVYLNPAFYNSPGGYYMVWDRCCRNNNINNISLPGTTGMLVRLFFPDLSTGSATAHNSSPEFGIPKESYACSNRLFTEDLSATDADGDSLVYSLTNPLRGATSQTSPSISPPSNGPYIPVIWQPGYSAQNFIIGSLPPSINPNTGALTFNPFITGLFVYAVKVDEYRNGVKIGSVQRDFQIYVFPCPPISPPYVSIEDEFGNPVAPSDTLVIDLNERQCIDFTLIDSTQGDGRSSFVLAGATSANVFSQPTPVANANLTGFEVQAYRTCVNPCEVSDGDVVSFVIVAREDNCPDALETMRTVIVRLIGKSNAAPYIYSDQTDAGIPQLRIGESISFNVFGEDSVDLSDQLMLTFGGRGFDPASIGATFDTRPGRGKVSGRFALSFNCEKPIPAGKYEFLFKVNDNFCQANSEDSLSVTIEVLADEEEKVPFTISNVVTANGDGLNDFFKLPVIRRGACANEFGQVRIFNRWGKLVFESDNQDDSWGGEGLPTGHYFYEAVYEKATYKGIVTLMR